MKKVFRLTARLSCLLVLSLFLSVPPCSAKVPAVVPAPLTPWVDWALHGQEEKVHCVAQYNDANRLQCNWPTELAISLDDSGGSFHQTWQVKVNGWVLLPGAGDHWPTGVQVNGKAAVVTLHNNSPAVRLEPGQYTLTGAFHWQHLPEFLQIPPWSGLVSLTLQQKKIPFPDIDDSGHLWLKRAQQDKKIEDRLKIEAFRLIDDSIPARITILFTLDVAGSARETTLGPLYSRNTCIPLSLQSALPAKLEEDGRLRVQLRPGRYTISLLLRHVGPIRDLTFNQPEDGFWPPVEIWSFLSHPSLRLVETNGAPTIDPLQTALPKKWQNYPAYRLEPGNSLHFKEIKRGDPQPPPDRLTLNRNLWLRFDGSGYTIQDRIKGEKNTRWRLEMSSPLALGKVEIDGTSQVITRQAGSDRAGIEVRKGTVNLLADSSYTGDLSSLPTTGWDHDFQNVKGRLFLPPGWKLLATGGIDTVRQTWLKQWTLLDFFLVLIFTITVARLFSLPMGVLAFLTLVLTFHEYGAPRYIWLALLVGFALLKYLPDSTFKQIVKVYQAGAVLLLILLAIPYSIQALRVGIYPQLAIPYQSMAQYGERNRPTVAPAPPMQEARLDQVSDDLRRATKKIPQKALGSMGKNSSFYTKVMQYDPKALTQTGPGLPQWRPFETISFSWSGPVSRDQSISLTLIGPRTNLILAFVRVFLILGLALSMFMVWMKSDGRQLPRPGSLFVLPFLLLTFGLPGLAGSTEIPSTEMLNQLQERLLQPDDCFPACAELQTIQITITRDRLSLVTTVDARIETAIPLPGHSLHWLPDRVLVDDHPAKGLLRLDNHLWLFVPEGTHVITLSGPIRQQNTLQLVLPLKPHYASVEAHGWSVTGLHSPTNFDSQLQFKRVVDHNGGATGQRTEILETGILPPFASVERTLLLGLSWKVKTTVRRMGAKGSPMVLDIPLLPGESVLSKNIRVEKDVARINFRPDQNVLSWDSFLESSNSITLTHAETEKWTEIWKVDVSPIFHMDYEGLDVILHKTGNRWYPTWHPWPGETVTLRISRPRGVEGRTMTIEKSHLILRPGHHSTAARLTLSISSSQGGQQTITLPEGAALQEVKINTKVQIIRQEGTQVVLPITPGKQTILLKWQQPEGMSSLYTTPAINLGNTSVNANVDIRLPENRWPLFIGGEQLVGPAVLFWSVLIIVILVAIGLGRTGLTPLTTIQWLLLGIGMSMSTPIACLIVVCWLLGLEFRDRLSPASAHFNRVQVGLGLLTVAALGALLFGISNGLLGHPDMNIIGNGSRGGLLRWYQDVSGATLPRGWVFSIPMWAYRAAMLGWALWISFWLISILKWGWARYSHPVIWHKDEPAAKTDDSDAKTSYSIKEHKE